MGSDDDAANILRRWIDGDVECSQESLWPLDRPRRSLSGTSMRGGHRSSSHHSESGDTDTDTEGGSSRWRAMFGRDSVRRSVSSGLPIFEPTALERATEASTRRSEACDYLRIAEHERRRITAKVWPQGAW